MAEKSTSSSSSPNLAIDKLAVSDPFASVHDIVGGRSALGYSTTVGISLKALKDVLEAADTLPCVKYIAAVGVKVLEVTEDSQTNKDSVRNLALRASDVIIAVARACAGAEGELSAVLESDLRQLTRTMNDIRTFVTEKIAPRPGYKKLLYRAEDAATLKALESQMTHAFEIFQIQACVSLCINQQQLMNKMAAGDRSSDSSSLVRTIPLRVPEGIYVIRNAQDGRVLEIEHGRLRTERRNLHIYVAPFCEDINPYQLWVVFKREGKEYDYTIRNLAVGAILDVFCGHDIVGTQVIGHSAYGTSIQRWAFYGTRSAASYDYCTIRSLGPPTAMDAKCPNPFSNCQILHMSRLRPDGPPVHQEWSLTRFPITTSIPRAPTQPPYAPAALPETIPRRKYLLQNVATGGYATATGLEDRMDDANILIESDPSQASTWHFVFATKDPLRDHFEERFAIVVGDGQALASLEYYNERHVAASYDRYAPSHHGHIWRVIPRDGAFTFAHAPTNRLLCQRRSVPIMDTAPQTAFSNPTCQWRLIDADTGKPCPVLYDATVSVVPPELAGSPTKGAVTQVSPPRLLLRTQEARAELVECFAACLQYEHELVQNMLKTGYTAIVLFPQFIVGWKDGRISKTRLSDVDTQFGMPRFAGKGGFDACSA